MTETATPTAATTRIAVETVQADHETRERNSHRLVSAQDAGRSAEPCFLCGRPLTTKAVDSAFWVEVGDGGSTILPNDHDDDETLGCFPLGSECSKRIPKTHRRKFDD